jgi:cytochrome c biogenesis protein CcdA
VPFIVGLVRDPGTRAGGVAMLAWYNLLFVLPLVGVLGLAVAGVGSSTLAAWGKRHWGLTKLLMAIVFAAMAVWMAPGLVWPPGVR